MAYRRRGYRRKGGRRYGGKKVVQSKGGPQITATANVSDIAKAAWSGVKWITRFINTEAKCRFVVGTATPSNSGNTAINLSPISLGNNQDQRTGNSVKPLNLAVKMNLRINDNSNVSQVRVVIFRQHQEQCTLNTQANIMEYNGILSHKQDEKRFQTKFLYDKMFSLDTSNGKRRLLEFVLKLHGHINFDDNVSGTNPTNMGVYLLLIADGYSSTYYPYVDYNTRLSFTDN